MAGFLEFSSDFVMRASSVPLPGTEALIVLDLMEEIRGPALRDRLRHMPIDQAYELVVLRGLSRTWSLLNEADMLAIRDAFGECAWIGVIDFEGWPQFNWLLEGRGGAPLENRLFEQVREIDVRARLDLSGSVWQGDGFHFSLPSGRHCSRFVRLGDLLSDPIQVSRIADWIAYQVPLEATLVVDSGTVLSLALEIRQRLAVWGATESSPIVSLPLYSTSYSEAVSRLSAFGRGDLLSAHELFCIVSVSSSGEYSARVRRVSTATGMTLAGLCCICECGPDSSPDALTHLPSELSDPSSCALCRSTDGAVIDIEPSRFAPRLATEAREMTVPRATELKKLREFLAIADQRNAIQVHLSHVETGRHFPCYIRIASLLEDPRARDRLVSLASVASSGGSDAQLLVLDADDADDVLHVLRGAGYGSAQRATIDSIRSNSLASVLDPSRRIILTTGIVRSSRTLRFYIEAIQRLFVGVESLDLRAVTLVHSPSSAGSEWGIRSRFYIDQEYRFYAGWTIWVDDSACPWCAEAAYLDYLRSSNSDGVDPYIAERFERISTSGGLERDIFLLAERASALSAADAAAAIRTTPSAYLGSIGDSAAFLGVMSTLQAMRSRWDRDLKNIHSRPKLPLANLARVFTDPVIIASFLRALRRPELSVHSEHLEIRAALSEIGHPLRHPIVAAELARAEFEGLVPRNADLVERDDSSEHELQPSIRALRSF
jgi:hypothetical protein